MKNMIFAILLAFAAGAFVPIQTAANTYLSKGLGHGMMSTFVVFVVATITSLLVLLVQRPAIPTLSAMAEIPWYAWLTGGVLGSAYILILIYTAPKLGMATVVGLVVVGQIFVAMILDHFGWLGLSIHAFNWKRLIGALLMIFGLIMIKKF